MSDLDLSTILAYLAGAAVFVCAVMVMYLSMQRVPPGFGLWTASSVLVAIGCALLADRGHFPGFLTTLVIPGAVVLAAAFRFEGLRRFLGRKRFDRRTLFLPIVVVALLAVFAYAWDKPSARGLVTTAAIALVFWITAGVVLMAAKERHRLFYRFLGALFLVYGVLWLGCGAYWLARSTGFPLLKIDTSGLVFFVAVTLFELFWVITCLILGAKRTADDLEVARGEVERERRQLADIVACLPDATVALDKDRQVVAWNRSAEEATGLSAKDVVGKRWDGGPLAASGEREDTLAEALLSSADTIPSRYKEVQRKGDTLSAEEERPHPRIPGKTAHYVHTAALLRDVDGEVTGALESVRDVSWRVEAERALQESEDRYRSLFEQSLDGILVVAPGGTVLEANPAACRMLGMTKEALCAADPADLVQRSADAQERLQDGSTPGTAVQELTFVRKDGTTFPAECMSVVWNDASGHLHAFVQFRDVSDRAESERTLREGEARLLEAQAASHVGNWEIDLVAESIWMSPEALRIFGIEQVSPYFPLQTSDLSSLAEDPSVLVAALEDVMSRGGSYDVEYRIRRANDGTLRTIHSFGAAAHDGTGTLTKVTGAVQDVSDTGRTESGLDLAQYSVDHAGEQVFWISPDGRFMRVSDSTCSQLGYTRDELLSMTIWDVDPTLDPHSTEGWDTLKALGSRRHEAVHRTKDGRDMPVEVSANYILHHGQEYNFVFARDISERKRLEEMFRRSQLSVDLASELIFWTNPEGGFVFATDSTCGQLGYAREELLEMTISDVDTAAPKDWRRRWAAIKEQGTLIREAVFRTKEGGEMPVEVNATCVDYEGGEYVLAIARNIGERKRETGLPTTSEIEALQVQKLEAVGQLAGGIAHDFNNLLTAIIGYGNLILANEEAQGLKSLRRDAEEIRSAAERAASLTSQILAFARRQALHPRVASLGEMVSGMERRLRGMIGEKIELAIVRPSEASYVEVDTDQFEQVVLNLVRNACEAMLGGGRLSIEVNNVELTEESSGVSPELSPGRYVLLSVSDTGAGMDPETKLRIFEPFFTTKKPGEGAGLGLSMVYGTVRQSGGHVLVYSEVGRGTTLKVYLPRVAGPAEPRLTTVPRVTEAAEPLVTTGSDSVPKGGNEMILVVEDEAPLRRLVARILGDLGYRVFVAGSGPEALELLEDLGERPDLLITDVVLPGGLQGDGLARELVAAAPGLPVLYMSGHPRDTIVHAGRLDEGVSFLGKPFTPQGLAAKVREVLGARPQQE